jgi:hypothetical protein
MNYVRKRRPEGCSQEIRSEGKKRLTAHAKVNFGERNSPSQQIISNFRSFHV